MKRFITILTILLFLLFNINTSIAIAETKTLTQGIYNARDANLLIGAPLTARITPTNSSAIIIIVDSNEIIQALVRLNPKIPQQILPPLDYNYSVIIFGNGTVVLS
ncbi:hypothetical protein [Clostridium beijerinckii]|uniref:hypothetical protein n=1 Tax=Clostridium beijerinckii TaxID=1520 RepID=UPI00098CCEBC|nr:hypothetical protein [Clostridium beijerinckii]MBA8936474.1 hypothetical protein [Clostridium beijerinckii]NOW02457.1 hypothetical protein [Clostridium beijerinckii]NRU41058.1 hypothetical protein [Clostridium beijerinckii]NSA95667.1 hypothetical protein [Clostridium beijerinckii]NYC05579.1 hypothetical protein [Clostridium beijerinckii]